MANPEDAPVRREELDALFVAAYAELRRLAASVVRRERSLTLTPTALVNQVWIKLAASPRFTATSPVHFKSIAARAMRQVLVEVARHRQARKRGGGEIPLVFDDSMPRALPSGRALVALDAALTDLKRLNPRQAENVECRYFGGLSAAEIAELQGVSEATVLRDWRAARNWLQKELRATS